MCNPNEIKRRSFVFTFNPEILRLVNEKKYDEIRDMMAKELNQLEEEKHLVYRTTMNQAQLDDIFERYQQALRMYFCYYTLADKQAKGTLKKEGAWK